MLHQDHHWKTKGSYGSHLLFERLYEGSQELSDEAAEKALGVYGPLTSEEPLADILNRFKAGPDPSREECLEKSLQAEKSFQEFATKVYNQLKENETLTLGVDDMIMNHVNKSEVHSYLLQQAMSDK